MRQALLLAIILSCLISCDHQPSRDGQAANSSAAKDAVSVLAASLLETYDELVQRHGADTASWKMPNAPRPFTHKNFLGVPQAAPESAMQSSIEQNRGTENNMAILEEEKIIAYEALPPGNSGFVNQQGERSPHYADQFELYRDFKKKRMWFYKADVEANAKSTLELRVVRP